LVVRRIEHNYHIVRAHCPEFLDDLHAHFLGLCYRRIPAFDRVLNVADTLFGKLNETNIPTHNARSFRAVFLPEHYCRFADAQKVRSLHRSSAWILAAWFHVLVSMLDADSVRV